MYWMRIRTVNSNSERVDMDRRAKTRNNYTIRQYHRATRHSIVYWLKERTVNPNNERMNTDGGTKNPILSNTTS